MAEVTVLLCVGLHVVDIRHRFSAFLGNLLTEVKVGNYGSLLNNHLAARGVFNRPLTQARTPLHAPGPPCLVMRLINK